MIAVVGHPALRLTAPSSAGGRASEIALEAARRGVRVELIGACGDDAAGDALLFALASAGIGHAAMRRDAARATPTIAPAPEDGPDDDTGLFEPSPGREAAATGASASAATDVAPELDGADVALGLAYLTSFSVLVVTDDVAVSALPAAVEGAVYAGAHLVLLLPAGAPVPPGLPGDATVLAAPADGDEGAFGVLVGAYATAIARGSTSSEAFAIATGAAGWEPLASTG